MTHTELKAEAEKTRQRELIREEDNLLYNIRHARTEEERQQAQRAYDVWCKHIR